MYILHLALKTDEPIEIPFVGDNISEESCVSGVHSDHPHGKGIFWRGLSLYGGPMQSIATMTLRCWCNVPVAECLHSSALSAVQQTDAADESSCHRDVWRYGLFPNYFGQSYNYGRTCPQSKRCRYSTGNIMTGQFSFFLVLQTRVKLAKRSWP